MINEISESFHYFYSFLFLLLFLLTRVTVLFCTLLLLQGFFSTLHNAGFFLNYPLASLTNMLQSKSILHLTVHEYLWGYEDPLIRLASGILPNYIDFGRFGLLDRVSRFVLSCKQVTTLGN